MQNVKIIERGTQKKNTRFANINLFIGKSMQLKCVFHARMLDTMVGQPEYLFDGSKRYFLPKFKIAGSGTTGNRK